MGQRIRHKEMLTDALLRWHDALAQTTVSAPVKQDEFALLWTTRILAFQLLNQHSLEPISTLREMATALAHAESEDCSSNILSPFLRRLDAAFPGSPFAPSPRIDTIRLDPSVLTDTLLEAATEFEYTRTPPYSLTMVGRSYERFLGRLMEPRGGRKSRGVYYTPRPIVDHMLKQTLVPMLDGCSEIEAVESLRILDPACGNGIFLMGAFDCFVHWYREHFRSLALTLRDDRRFRELTLPEHRQWVTIIEDPQSGKLTVTLSMELRLHILTSHLKGVDIDPRSTSLARLCLGLHAIDGVPTNELFRPVDLFQPQVLPDLSQAILTGNSLINTDVSDLIKQTSLLDHPIESSTIDWANAFPCMAHGGFDVVIGNPPYDVLEKERGNPRSPHALAAAYLRSHPDYEAARGGKLNLFRCFMIRGLKLTREGGAFSMIVPMAIMGDASCSRARAFVFSHLEKTTADCFPNKDRVHQRVFEDAKLSTVIISGRSARTVLEEHPIEIRVYPGGEITKPDITNVVTLADANLVSPRIRPVPIVDEAHWLLCRRIYERDDVVPLGEVTGIRINRGEINQTLYGEWIREEPLSHSLIRGAEVAPFGRRPKPSQGTRKWLHQGAWARRGEPREEASMRRIALQRITGMDEARRLIATLMEPPAFFADSTNSMLVSPEDRHAPEYVVGLLNSSLFQWRFKITSSNNNVSVAELEALPFRIIDRRVAVDQALHDQIVRCVQALMNRRAEVAELPSDSPVLRQELLDELEWAVGELYGLDRSEMERIATPWGRHAN